MDIIERVVGAAARDARPIIDTVALTWEQRRKSRQRLRTVQGQEVVLALPTGTRLQAGDLLPAADGWIAVELAPEQVLLIRPRSLPEAAFVAYQIGNRHLPIEIGDDAFKTPYEQVLEAYLLRQGMVVEQARLPFTPVSAMFGHLHS